MAAEFWEQGDLERTVLEQQPIVRTPTEITVVKSRLKCWMKSNPLESKDIIVEGKPPKQKQSEGNWTLTDAFQLSHSVITASFLLAATHQEQVTKLFSGNISSAFLLEIQHCLVSCCYTAVVPSGFLWSCDMNKMQEHNLMQKNPLMLSRELLRHQFIISCSVIYLGKRL